MASFNKNSPLEKKIHALEKLGKTIQGGIEDLTKKVSERKKPIPLIKGDKRSEKIKIKYSRRRSGS